MVQQLQQGRNVRVRVPQEALAIHLRDSAALNKGAKQCAQDRFHDALAPWTHFIKAKLLSAMLLLVLLAHTMRNIRVAFEIAFGVAMNRPDRPQTTMHVNAKRILKRAVHHKGCDHERNALRDDDGAPSLMAVSAVSAVPISMRENRPQRHRAENGMQSQDAVSGCHTYPLYSV